MAETIIVKEEDGKPILFFPSRIARCGWIECWTNDEGHSSADMKYYTALRMFHGDREGAVERYLVQYDRINDRRYGHKKEAK